MFSEWPRMEPEQDNKFLEDAQKTLIEFLRSLYIRGIRDPLRDSETGTMTLICSN